VADRFQAGGLYEHCLAEFGRALTVETAIQQLLWAHAHAPEGARGVAMKFVVGNGRAIQVRSLDSVCSSVCEYACVCACIYLCAGARTCTHARVSALCAPPVGWHSCTQGVLGSGVRVAAEVWRCAAVLACCLDLMCVSLLDAPSCMRGCEERGPWCAAADL